MLRVKLEGRSFCMRFWYHMFGDPGSLTVMRIVKEEKDHHIPTRKEFEKKLHKEWEKSEISDNKWLLAEVDLAVVRSVRRGTVHWVRCLPQLWLIRIARCISPFQINSLIKASLYVCLDI